jgi:hypothetical protein
VGQLVEPVRARAVERLEQSSEIGEVEVKAQAEVVPRGAAPPKFWIGVKGT